MTVFLRLCSNKINGCPPILFLPRIGVWDHILPMVWYAPYKYKFCVKHSPFEFQTNIPSGDSHCKIPPNIKRTTFTDDHASSISPGKVCFNRRPPRIRIITRNLIQSTKYLLVQLGHHVDQGYVEKHSRGQRENPLSAFRCVTKHNAKDQTDVAHARRHEVVHESLYRGERELSARTP